MLTGYQLVPTSVALGPLPTRRSAPSQADSSGLRRIDSTGSVELVGRSGRYFALVSAAPLARPCRRRGHGHLQIHRPGTRSSLSQSPTQSGGSPAGRFDAVVPPFVLTSHLLSLPIGACPPGSPRVVLIAAGASRSRRAARRPSVLRVPDCPERSGRDFLWCTPRSPSNICPSCSFPP